MDSRVPPPERHIQEDSEKAEQDGGTTLYVKRTRGSMPCLDREDDLESLPQCLRRVLASGGSCLFVSPHLDDVVLSCGSLLHTLASRTSVTVLTVFSEAGTPPHTLAAKSFLRQSGVSDATELYVRRRSEDRAALGQLGAEYVHLGLPDALFRRRPRGAFLQFAGRVLPELAHSYPTYWLDIARGRVASDDECAGALAVGLRAEAEKKAYSAVFCPLGIGSHVDHLITRDVGASVFPDSLFYGEFPYLLREHADRDFVARHHLKEWTWGRHSVLKHRALSEYHSQMSNVFPGGPRSRVGETYYVVSTGAGDG